MNLPDIIRRWLSQAEITAWEGIVIEMAKRQRDKEAGLKSDVEAQGWRLHLGAEPFIALTSNLEIKPLGDNRFEKRAPGGQWVRATPVRDFPQEHLVALQRVVNLLIEVMRLQQAARELPAAIEEFKREYQRHLDAVRQASPARLQEALEQLRRFYDGQEPALPIASRNELLDTEFQILLGAFRAAVTAKETRAAQEQLLDFFRRHKDNAPQAWEEEFVREEREKDFQRLLEELRRAGSAKEAVRQREQLLALAGSLPRRPRSEIEDAWNHALENNFPPETPADLRASRVRPEGINISWRRSLGATEYLIHRSNSTAPETKSFLDAIAAPSEAAASGPRFTDTDVAAGQEYFYWVNAKNHHAESDFAGPAPGKRADRPKPAEDQSTAFLRDNSAALKGSESSQLRSLFDPRKEQTVALAAAAAEKGDAGEVRKLIEAHPDWRDQLEPHLRKAERVKKDAEEEAARRLQIVLTQAAKAAEAGDSGVVRKLIEAHPNWREQLEPHLSRAEQVKKKAEEAEGQFENIISRAEAAAIAGQPGVVEELMRLHPEYARKLKPLLTRAQQVKALADKSILHIRQLQKILSRAAQAAAAGKPDEVQILMEKHSPFREQLMLHLHQAIQVQFQAQAKEAATPEAIESLKSLLQTHKDALKFQPQLVKALKSVLAETEARVHAEMEIKLLQENSLQEARNRAAAANSDQDIQLPELPDMTRSQAAKFAGEGDLDGMRSLIAANPRWEPQLVPFLREAVGTQVKRKALSAATDSDIVALEELIQQHRALLDQDVALAAELDETVKQARSAVKARFKRKMWIWFLILAILLLLIAVVAYRSGWTYHGRHFSISLEWPRPVAMISANQHQLSP